MKIRISRQDLLDAVNKVKSVVSARSALPILSHLLIEAKDSAIKLTATDLKVSIECSVDCTVNEPGTLTVSSQRLSSMLSELPEGDVLIQLRENNVIQIESGRIQTKLFSMSPDEFPPVREFEGIDPISMAQKTLKHLFSRTSFAICSDQARYNLTGLLFEIVNGKLSVVATDGRRMSLAATTENVPAGVDVKVIVPGKMIAECERLLADSDEEVAIFLDETQAAFTFGSTRLVSALIEGNFPNYEMVVPKKHDKEALVNTTAFLEATRRTRTMTNEKFNSVRYTIAPGAMTLRVVTPEVGEYTEDMPIDYQGDAVEIAFNPDFILDVLRHIQTDRLAFVLKDGTSPCLVKPFGDSPDESYLNVIMPIRI